MEKIIKDFLTRIRNECAYKRAYNPPDWVCIKISKVSKDLAEEIGEVIKMPRGDRTGPRGGGPKTGRGRGGC